MFPCKGLVRLNVSNPFIDPDLIDRLIVAEASVGKGLVMKRFQTRGRGRSAGIIKPFSHLTIVVRERAEAEDK